MVKREDHQKALSLRLEGKTYGEIKQALNIPKSTLSSWLKAVALPPHALSILQRKQQHSLEPLMQFNERRTLTIQKENQNISEEFKQKVKTLNQRELMLIGASLYWAEGYKNFNHKRKSYPYINFANSDPTMVVVFINFLEKVLKISKDKMRAIVYAYPATNKPEAIHYWQNITNIPKENFRLLQLVSKSSKGKRSKNLLPYGTLQLRSSGRKEFFKIQGLIDGIAKSIS